jgi:hypothetical protein
MKKAAFVVFLLWMAVKSFGANPGDSLKVDLVTSNLSFDPGMMHNLVVRIENVSHAPLNLKTSMEFPSGLKLAIPLPLMTLAPASSEIQMVSFNIPSQFLSGKYTVKVNFTEAATGLLLQVKDVEFSVNEKENIVLELLNVPGYVIGGEDINASYLLKNTGNSRRKFLIEPYNCNVVSSSTETLDPGESVTVDVVAKTNREITSEGSYSFSLQASLSEEMKKRDFRIVKVFPVKEEETDLYFRFPVSVSSRYLSRSRDGKYYQGYQLEARGRGYLDLKNHHKLEFMARGPNNFDLSFLGLYDEYYISYTNKHFESFWGNKSFDFTPLIETARYGKGFENTFITGNGSRIGIVYLEPRFYKDIKKEMAAYADICFYKENRVGFYFLTKKVNTVPDQAILESVKATLKPFKNTSTELEYSQGTYNGKKDNAYRLFLYSHFSIFNITANYFNAGKFYPGYYSNSSFYNGNLNINLTKSLRIEFSAREDFTNAAMDTLLSTAPYSKMLMSSAYYKVNQNLSVRAYYFNYQRKDRMPVKQFDYHTESLNGEINHNLNKFGYRLGGEFGKTTNNLLSSDASILQNSYRISLNLTYRPSYLFSIQSFTSYSNMNSFIAKNQKNLLWGISANGQLTKNLKTTFQVQNSYAIEDYYLNRNLFQFSLDYSFLKRHKLSANSYYMLFQNHTDKPDLTIALTYTVQIGIPLKKTKEAGSVTGTLVGINGEPANGVILYLNGRTGITRENGEFSFKDVIPGKYQLMADRTKLPLDEVLNVPVPLILEVNANQATNINLQLIKAGRIKGKIAVTETESAIHPLNQQTPALGNIVIDLKDGMETIRIISNQDGSFEFPQLRPGNWILHVFKNNIDRQFILEKESYELSLAKGEVKDVNIKLVPRTRKIIFKSSNINLSDESKPAEKTQTKTGQDYTPVSKDEIWFSVQIASALQPIPTGSAEFRGERNTLEKNIKGRYKYFLGKFPTVEQAIRYRDVLNSKFPGVFVVAFEGEELIPMNDAYKKVKLKSAR